MGNDGVNNLEEKEKNSGAGRVVPLGGSAKLKFLRFHGEGLKGWLLRAEYFFKVEGISLDNKVKVAALHLEGRAIQW